MYLLFHIIQYYLPVLVSTKIYIIPIDLVLEYQDFRNLVLSSKQMLINSLEKIKHDLDVIELGTLGIEYVDILTGQNLSSI